ncbi:hypothetical protein DOM22_08785 [Bdellovibrio sp. ZAP7]|uniref:hypothetical protein n=1 Tax=Bdellovibrio sp. ZAP7 TaxID=2231053 RepID=UPI001159EB5C|nr:hypothetical protein [Bdellovibrio sp. ZAP7]QDK45244.1 hypothetical protein DOM22_08785 [Bdellovibrio sp. ZAP7]
MRNRLQDVQSNTPKADMTPMGVLMKYLLIALAMMTYSHQSFAQLDADIEAEMSMGQSEEAKIDAQEQKNFLAREKIRKEQMKQQALKSAQEAKNMEAAAAREAQRTRVEKEQLTVQVKEYQRQIKMNEERKAKAQKQMEFSKAEAEHYKKVAGEYRAKRDASLKELDRLNEEGNNIAKWTREAKEQALKAQRDAAYAAAKAKQKESYNERARADGSRVYRGVSSEGGSTPYGK